MDTGPRKLCTKCARKPRAAKSGWCSSCMTQWHIDNPKGQKSGKDDPIARCPFEWCSAMKWVNDLPAHIEEHERELAAQAEKHVEVPILRRGAA
jgi:hypothetical protein